MDACKAVDLVVAYSHHTRKIKELTKQISNGLTLCMGVGGNRGEKDFQPKSDRRGRDMTTHLWQWYNLGVDVPDEQKKLQCIHCFEAHQAIQERKENIGKLGYVKRAMTKIGV